MGGGRERQAGKVTGQIGTLGFYSEDTAPGREEYALPTWIPGRPTVNIL